MLITIIYLAPIIVSIVALIVDFKKGINKKALIVSAMFAMVAEMFAMKYIAGTWYILVFSLIVPLAVVYTLICLYLSLKERKKDGGTREGR